MANNKLSKSLRQEKMRKLMEDGFTQAEIAKRLNVSLKTINTDFKEIKSSLKHDEKERQSFNDKLSLILKLPATTFDKVTPEDRDFATDDMVASVFMELKRRLPIMSNEEVINVAITLFKEDMAMLSSN